jgi:23S rRNA-/tRNA-specific pseudouridylate synthase
MMSAPILDAPGEARRRAQLDYLVAQGVFTKAQQDEFLENQPAFLRLEFGVGYEDERYILMSKPFDARLDLGNNGERNFPLEITAADWLASRGIETLRFCHQLDAATSGLLLAAKDRAAANAACKLFEKRLARKQYLALVFGHVQPLANEQIDVPIGPVPDSPFMQQPLDEALGGKPAQTAVRVLRHGELALRGEHQRKPASLLLLEPRTGRRHQLRVHCKMIGHPIVGDGSYAGDWDSYRMFLHAHRLCLSPLPVEGGKLDVRSDCPEFDDALSDAREVEPLEALAASGGWLTKLPAVSGAGATKGAPP